MTAGTERAKLTVALLSLLTLSGAWAQSPIEPPPPAADLTAMTYNIRAGRGSDSREPSRSTAENLTAIAEVIERAGAEVVLLQEVDRGVDRSDGLDEAAILADSLGMNHVFAPAMEFGGGEYGIALLTTWQIESHEVISLFRADLAARRPDLPDYFSEPRIALLARLTSGGESLTIINTHLGLTPEQRELQLREIVQVVADLPLDKRIIFGGDLNCEPDARELAPVRLLLDDCYQGFLDERRLPHSIPIPDRLTFPADDPVRCIDYLFVRGIGRILVTRVLDTEDSDHRPVVTHLRLGPPPPR